MCWLKPSTDSARSFGNEDYWNWRRWISLGLWNSLDLDLNLPGCALSPGCEATCERKPLVQRSSLPCKTRPINDEERPSDNV
jgi:hypothetical protein